VVLQLRNSALLETCADERERLASNRGVEIVASFLPNKSALPASTLLQVVRLADPSYLIEVDAIAILAPAN